MQGPRSLDWGAGGSAEQDGETCDVLAAVRHGPHGTGRKSPPEDGFTRSLATNMLVEALPRSFQKSHTQLVRCCGSRLLG